MNLRLLLTVLLLFAGASCADAGVIVDQPVDNTVSSSSASLSVVSDWMASQQCNDTPQFWEWGQEGGFAGFAITTVQTGGTHALLSSELLWMTTPTPLWQIALTNSTLPVCPLLDGLLKPA